MKTLPGVSTELLIPQIKEKLDLIDRIYDKYHAGEAVVTSTNGGQHMFSSLHYKNAAIDFRLPHTNQSAVYKAIRRALGDEFDVVPEETHLHVEYDPHKPKALKGENI